LLLEMLKQIDRKTTTINLPDSANDLLYESDQDTEFFLRFIGLEDYRIRTSVIPGVFAKKRIRP